MVTIIRDFTAKEQILLLDRMIKNLRLFFDRTSVPIGIWTTLAARLLCTKARIKILQDFENSCLLLFNQMRARTISCRTGHTRALVTKYTKPN